MTENERLAILQAVDEVMAEREAVVDAKFAELVAMVETLKGDLAALESRAATARGKGKQHGKR